MSLKAVFGVIVVQNVKISDKEEGENSILTSGCSAIALISDPNTNAFFVSV